MKAISIQTLPTVDRILHILLIGLITTIFVVSCRQPVSGQCVDHPGKKTAIVFSNESSYALTFFIDDEEKAFVRSRAVSGELNVEPGEHLLRARAIIRGKSFWVATVNDVPKAQVCTWNGAPSSVATTPADRDQVIARTLEWIEAHTP